MRIIPFVLIVCLYSSVSLSEISFAGMLNALSNLYGIDLSQLSALENLHSTNSAIKNSNLDIFNLNTQQFSAMTGHYGAGDLFNNKKERSRWRWGSTGFLSVDGKDLNAENERFAQLFQDYQTRYPELDPNKLISAEQGSAKTQFEHDSAVANHLAMASANYLYDGVQTEVEKMESLIGLIEKSENEKSAIDLNSRLIGEMALIELESLRLQSIQTQLAAMSNQGRINGVKDNAEFMFWSKGEM